MELRSRKLTSAILDAAIEVHRVLGPGMVESAYEDGMCIELAARGLRFRRQARFDAEYKGRRFEKRYRIDLLVEDEVVVEIKAVREVTDVHPAQLLTYLRHTRKRVGLLLNFNVALLRDGIHRRVL